ncbi:hypothetical protein GO730_35120 [Spirosoma sp. HMF3257]|nr:hypothetical protein [Spirosoma telluris]
MKVNNILLFVILLVPILCNSQNKIQIHLAPGLKGPYTGRLVVYTLSDTTKQFGGPMSSDNAGFAIEVSNWGQGQVQEIDASSHWFLKNIDSLTQGYYKFVAILDTNRQERAMSAPGNLYTRNEGILQVISGQPNVASIILNSVFLDRKFAKNDSINEVKLRSDLLSDFRKESIFLKAGIIFPASYFRDTTRVFPVVYIIPGWGGTHFNALSKNARNAYGIGQGKDKVYVFLNPETQTPWGLHAFVDSRVNGPWGTALVKELMPFIASQFRVSKDPALTFITGQSSGGYGAIWLALHYSEKFGGCWATAPDPIDFSSFTGVDIYLENNFYQDRLGRERGIFLMNGTFRSTLRQARLMEELEGDGGQQQSFEAAFGLSGADGRPRQLFDVKTGKINKTVSRTWKEYDLAFYVQRHWKEIKKKRAGRIRIYVGSDDNFRLNESVASFTKKVKTINADIHCEVIPAADHFSLRSPKLIAKIQQEMDAIIQQFGN